MIPSEGPNVNSVRGWIFAGERNLKQVAYPEPTLGLRDVAIKVNTVGICGSDLHMYLCQRAQPIWPAGHEFAGHIVKTGDGVRGLSVGDRVCVSAVSYCGACKQCISGRGNLCVSRTFIPETGPGGFSEVAIVRASCAKALPDEVTFEEGALVEPLAVGLHALRMSETGPSERIGIVGGGTIGLCTLICAKALGYRDVGVLARHKHQKNVAMTLGASCTFDEEEWHSERRAFDAVVCTTSTSSGFAMGLSSVRSAGRLVLLGGYSNLVSVDLRSVVSREIEIVGSMCYAGYGVNEELDRIIAWLHSGKVCPRDIVTHRFSADRLPAAFATAADKASGSIKVHAKW